jgi:hypothetical protein
VAIPRRYDPARRGDVFRYSPMGAPLPQGRPATPAEYQRRYRAGRRSPRGRALDPVWERPRNSLPWRPYTYRGTGRDAFDGTCLFDEVTS